MTHSFKNPLLVTLLVLILVISSYFIWKYLDIKNQELQIKVNQEKIEIVKIKVNQELTEMKTYEDSFVGFNDTIVKVSTKWRDGKMDYKINLPVSEKLFQAINKSNNWSSGLTIELIDKDGFKIDSIYLPLMNSTRIVDENDKMIGKRDTGSLKISSESYLMITGIRILSTIE